MKLKELNNLIADYSHRKFIIYTDETFKTSCKTLLTPYYNTKNELINGEWNTDPDINREVIKFKVNHTSPNTYDVVLK